MPSLSSRVYENEAPSVVVTLSANRQLPAKRIMGEAQEHLGGAASTCFAAIIVIAVVIFVAAILTAAALGGLGC